MKVIAEANSDLLGKTYVIPLRVRQFLQSMAGSGGEGTNRINNLLSNSHPTYEQIKRFKHDIENTYSGDWSIVLNWINGVLNTDRNALQTKKQVTMDTGMENRFIKNHEKDAATGIAAFNENKKVMKIKITEEQKKLLKEEILKESEDYSRYKASALKEVLVEKQQQLANLKQDIKNITNLLNSKIKKQSPVQNNELSDNINFEVPELN